MDLEADGLISVYDLETSNVIATLEGLEVYYAIKNAIFVLDDIVNLVDIPVLERSELALQSLINILNERK